MVFSISVIFILYLISHSSQISLFFVTNYIIHFIISLSFPIYYLIETKQIQNSDPMILKCSIFVKILYQYYMLHEKINIL